MFIAMVAPKEPPLAFNFACGLVNNFRDALHTAIVVNNMELAAKTAATAAQKAGLVIFSDDVFPAHGASGAQLEKIAQRYPELALCVVAQHESFQGYGTLYQDFVTILPFRLAFAQQLIHTLIEMQDKAARS